MTSFDFNWKSDNKAPTGVVFARKKKHGPIEKTVFHQQSKPILQKEVRKPTSEKESKLDSDVGKQKRNKSHRSGYFSKIIDKSNIKQTNDTINETNDSTKLVNRISKKNNKAAVEGGSSNQTETLNKQPHSLFALGHKDIKQTNEAIQETNESTKLIKRKWKKDKIAAAKNGFPNQTETLKKQPHSLFAVGHKDVYVKGNTKAKSVVEKVFSASKKFSDLDIHKFITSNLEKNNLTTLTNVQEKSIPVILKGNDVLIRSQTGSGKTLAYAIPILDALQKISPRLKRNNGVQAIIVVPTRELALQSHDVFTKINTFQWIVSGHLCGGENRNTEKSRLRKGVHVLIATPGRLLDHMLHTNAFKTDNVRCIVLDEADRLLDMGFKKDIVRIIEELDNSKKNLEYNPMALLKKNFPAGDKNFDSGNISTDSDEQTDTNKMPLLDPKNKRRQTLLLSATLTQGIVELADFMMKEHTFVDALEDFGKDNPDMLVIPNTVHQKFIVTHTKHRLFMLSAMLLFQLKMNSKVFVFMGTSDMVDYHYELFTRYLVKLPRGRGKLKSDNILLLEEMEEDSDDEEKIVDAEFFKLHGNMDQGARKDVFTRFRAAKKGILICTDVVARGIDILAADCIIQYNGPQSIEDYLHRVGRTGRAGKSGTSYIFLTHDEQDFVTEMEKHRVYLQKQETDHFLNNLSNIMDEPDHEQAATALQKRFERALENDKELHRSALMAYASWSRFYNTYSNKMSPIFNFKNANLGHYVTSFGLKETPTGISRVLKGQFTKKETPRLNQKLQIHIDEGKPKFKNPRKKNIKSISLTTSEFSSGLGRAKKRRKNEDFDEDI